MRDWRETIHRETSERRLSSVREFSLTSVRRASRMVVRACGRLVLGHGAHDALWAPHLDAGAVTEVTLDLSGVDEIDARGIGVLAQVTRRAMQRGIRVSVLAASGVVQRLAEITRLDRALPGAWHLRDGVLSCADTGPAVKRAAAPEPACCPA